MIQESIPAKLAQAPVTRDLTPENMTGAQKSAVLLVALGAEVASSVLKTMRDDEVERVTIEIARLRNVSSDVIEAALVEYRELNMAHDYVAQGGVAFARDALQNALGSRRAEEVMMRVEAAMEVSAFHLLQTVETSQLTNFLQSEHPQTAALILAHLNPRKAAEIISTLDPENQHEIMFRLGTMGKTSPELLRDIEDVIRQQIGSVIGAELSASGGIEAVATILNSATRQAESSIMEAIRGRDADLASQIKALMFVFDDLVNVSDRDMQRILIEVDQKDLALSLKAASPELKDKLLRNVSERAAEMIKEEVELLGPARVTDVDEAQRRIVETAQQLEDQEEIVLSRTADDVFV